jgi:hypothetical protein
LLLNTVSILKEWYAHRQYQLPISTAVVSVIGGKTEDSYALNLDDIDNDGDLDTVVNNLIQTKT